MRFLPLDWWDYLTSEEVEQENQLMLWKHPCLEGYQGLFSFGALLYQSYNDARSKDGTDLSCIHDHERNSGPEGMSKYHTLQQRDTSCFNPSIELVLGIDPYTDMQDEEQNRHQHNGLLSRSRVVRNETTCFDRYVLLLVDYLGIVGTSRLLSEPVSNVDRMISLIRHKVRGSAKASPDSCI